MNKEVEQVLSDIERSEKEIQGVWAASVIPNARLTYTYFYLAGVANRALSQSSAFRAMIAAKNTHVAGSLIRMQMDTVMRLYALFWVSHPEQFAERVFRGERIDRMKDRHGKVMSDKHLRSKLEDKYPWLHDVYNKTSGFIHFSSEHMFSGIEMKNRESGEAVISIGPGDPKRDPEDYLEFLHCFSHLTMLFIPPIGHLFDEMWDRLGVSYEKNWQERIEKARAMFLDK